MPERPASVALEIPANPFAWLDLYNSYSSKKNYSPVFIFAGVCNLNMSKSGLLGMDKYTWCLGLRKNGEMVAFHNKNQVSALFNNDPSMKWRHLWENENFDVYFDVNDQKVHDRQWNTKVEVSYVKKPRISRVALYNSENSGLFYLNSTTFCDKFTLNSSCGAKDNNFLFAHHCFNCFALGSLGYKGFYFGYVLHVFFFAIYHA